MSDYLELLSRMTGEEITQYISANTPLAPEVVNLLFNGAGPATQNIQNASSHAPPSNHAQRSNDVQATGSVAECPKAVSASQRNEFPCAPCKARKKKCTLIQHQPKLCEFCFKQNQKECLPELIKPPGAKSAKKTEGGFVYEYMSTD